MKDLVVKTESFDFVRHLIAFMKADADGIRTVRLCNNVGDSSVRREINKRTSRHNPRVGFLQSSEERLTKSCS